MAALGVRYVKKKAFFLVLTACLFASLSTVALHIPILGGIWGLLSLAPLWEFFPELEQTGTHVEFGFLWLIVKSFYGWFVITAYYLLIWLLILGSFTLIKNLRSKKSIELNT